MPKNPKNSNKEVLNKFNQNATKQNMEASIKSTSETPKNYIFKMLYGEERLNSDVEKEIIVNQFFADLIDGNSIKWNIKIGDNESKVLEKLLPKYLKRTDFATKLWQTKFKSGLYGKYGMLIVKQFTGRVLNGGLKEALPNAIPVRIIYKNEINDHIFDIEIEYDGYNFSNGKTIFYLRRHYQLIKGEVSVDNLMFDKNSVKQNESDLPKEWKSNLNLGVQKLGFPFIPVSILKNNYDETRRTSQVESRLKLINNFDENLAILPSWERGAIAFNSKPVSAQNQSLQNMEFMKDILQKGFVQLKPIEVDGNLMNLTDNLTVIKPNSIMQTTKATRDLIWNEIKEDLGLPSLNEVKSAQKTSAEVVAQQFLTSPIIEREKAFVKSFLIDFAKKFLIILKESQTVEKIPEFDLESLSVDLDFEITTEKNINQTIKQMNGDAKNETVTEENFDDVNDIDDQEIEKEENGKKSIWRRFIEWIRRRK